MKKRSVGFALALFVLLAGAVAILVGCELSNAGSTVREVGVDFSGFYDGVGESAFISPPNSGNRVKSLNLRQSGDQIQAIDNNNIVFNGTIGSVQVEGQNANASFTLEGRTTTDQPVTISGTLSGQGTSAEMKGTWIEADRYCNLRGDATISQPPSPSSFTLTVNVNPSGAGAVGLNPSGGVYSRNTQVTLTATPASNRTFTGWAGDLTGTANPATISMTANKSVTANFSTAQTSGGGSVIITTDN